MLDDLNSYKEIVFIGYGLVSQQQIASIFFLRKPACERNDYQLIN